MNEGKARRKDAITAPRRDNMVRFTGACNGFACWRSQDKQRVRRGFPLNVAR